MKNIRLYAWSLIVILALVATAVSALRYYKFGDYWVIANVACEPATESCFAGDGENTPEAYKTIQQKAYAIPSCNGWADECAPLTCETDGLTCTTLYCDTTTGEECVATEETG